MKNSRKPLLNRVFVGLCHLLNRVLNNRVVNSTWFSVFAGLCQIHLGLGFLGIVGGGSNTGSIISNVFGFAFLVGGVYNLFHDFSKCDRQKRVQLLVVFILGGSICLNFLLFSRAKQYYLELNQTRLDPLGLSAYTVNLQDFPKADHIRVVFFGDSRAASWPSPNLNGYEFVNRGISSQTSVQAVQRFSAHVRSLKPDIVVIQVGINDLKAIALFPKQRNAIVANCQANIKQIVDESRNLGAVAIVTTILPVGEVPLERQAFWSDAISQAVKEINAYIETLATEKTIVFDTVPILADSQGLMLQKYRENELHLNKQGYGSLNQKLAQLLPSIESKKFTLKGQLNATMSG
jgi:lysophospholipase L1-like esterase